MQKKSALYLIFLTSMVLENDRRSICRFLQHFFLLSPVFLFPLHRPAKCADFVSQAEVFAVGVGHEVRLREIQSAVFLKEDFIGVHAHDLREEHIVRAEFQDPVDLAFDPDRALGDSRRLFKVRRLHGRDP